NVLTAEELAASLGHEIGHRSALDNLKRFVMRAAPDLLSRSAAARDLERRWASAAEYRADRHACEIEPVGNRARVRCALASAIVKVARMAPPMRANTEPISTLVDDSDIALRVRTLVDDAGPSAAARPVRPWIAVALAAAVVTVGYAPLLRGMHVLSE